MKGFVCIVPPGYLRVLVLVAEMLDTSKTSTFFDTRSLFTIGGDVSEDRDIVLQPVKRCKDSFKVFPNDNIPKLASPLPSGR